MATSMALSQARRGTLAAMAGAAVLVALSACDLPLALGQPTTRALESGAADGLDAAKSFEITGTYTEKGDPSLSNTPASGARTVPPATTTWTMNLQVAKPLAEHLALKGGSADLEAIVLGNDAYFRGHQFLAQHLGSDPLSQTLVKAAGNAWWKGSAGLVPRLPNFTNGIGFRATFLGPAVTARSDHVSVGGVDAVALSGPRADVYIDASSPYHVLEVRLKKGAVIDGITDADFHYANFDRDFGISAPSDVIDFSNFSTLPPVYTVVSVDTFGCTSPCVVSALLKNLGGTHPAVAPSTVTFTMTDSASARVLGSCQAQVRPDVGYNSTTTVGCTIANVDVQAASAAIVTATANNPGSA